MTIGPEPSKRIFSMSSRLGMGTPRVEEAGKMVQRVVRARARPRVVLHRRAADVMEDEPLDRAVAEVYVRGLGRAVVRLPADALVGVHRPRAVRAEHREAVVLARDLDLARHE